MKGFEMSINITFDHLKDILIESGLMYENEFITKISIDEENDYVDISLNTKGD